LRSGSGIYSLELCRQFIARRRNLIVVRLTAHLHKKRGPTVETETRFRYVLGNPSDHSREITLTVMAFDVAS
jgi:hypothetical protein